MRSRRRTGFSLVEMMLVMGIIGVLASLSINEFNTQIMLAKRTEAVVGLNLVWKAEMAYLARAGRFAGTFDQLDFEVTGGGRLAPTVYQGARYTYQLSQPWGDESFYCIATAQLDSDPWPDIVEVFELDASGD